MRHERCQFLRFSRTPETKTRPSAQCAIAGWATFRPNPQNQAGVSELSPGALGEPPIATHPKLHRVGPVSVFMGVRGALQRIGRLNLQVALNCDFSAESRAWVPTVPSVANHLEIVS